MVYDNSVLEHYVSPVSVWDVKEPLRMISTLAVTTLSASIERSAWCKCSEKTDSFSETSYYHNFITTTCIL